MARGWESKSVESQMDDAMQRYNEKSMVDADERERIAKRSMLELSRRRIVRELEETSSDLRRETLRHSLSFLDEELRKS